MTQRTKFVDSALIIFAAIFGVGSIVLLVARGSSGYTHFGWPERDILVWDIFLSLLFFVQHSGMVRKPFREYLAKAVDPRYHGSIYTIASGIALSIVALFWQRSETTLLVLDGIPRLIAALCTLLAVLVFVLSASALRSFDPLGIGPVKAHLRGIDHTPGPFVVRGFYRWVRHPLYFCVLVMFWANPDVTLDRLLFNVLWTAWVYVATVREERDLTREFGEVYQRYQKMVPMLIPWRGPARL